MPIEHITFPINFPSYHPSASQHSNEHNPVVGKHYPMNEMIEVPAQTITLGKSRDYPSFGWDNEYGRREYQVPSFKASKYLITNGEYLEFIRDGGYGNLGLGNDETYSSPVQVATDKRFKRVVSFSGTTLAICLDGTMWGAGLGQYGLLGNGIPQGAYSTFVQSGGGRQWVDVQMNRYANSYAIRDPKL
jgi:hypothetical protein